MVGRGLTDNKTSAYSCGLDPWDLSKHINKYLPSTYKYSRANCYNDFSECAAAILQDILLGDPVIAFFSLEYNAGHYVNVIGVKEGTSECVEEFILLDTNQSFRSFRYHKMEYFMKNQYKHMLTLALWNEPNYDYYLIRFYKE